MSGIMDEILDDQDSNAFTDAPDEDESQTLKRLGEELATIDSKEKDLLRQLDDVKQRKKELTQQELPDYMRKIGQDLIGLPDFDVDISLEPYYHANIKKEWPNEDREKAFNWLIDGGHGDLIKSTITIVFSREQFDEAQELAQRLRDDGHNATVEKGVAWNTLTSFVREQTENGEELPLDLLGATVGTVAKLKKRKKK